MKSDTPVSTASESKSTRSTRRLGLVAVGCAVLVCLALAASYALAARAGRFNVSRAFLARTAQTPVALITLFASPTALASGTPTATASPTPSVVPTTLALDADFILDCDLFTGENEVRKYGCEDGEYVMLNKEATTRYSYYDVGYQDVDVEAQGHWVSGEGGYEYGIVWRASSDGDAYYIFVVTDDGKYNVALFKDDKYTDLIPYTASPLVHTGATPNRLRVVAQGDQFEFYLNDTRVGTVTDTNLTGGNVGLFFYNKEPNTTVAFDEFVVNTFDAPTPGAGTATTTPTPSPLARTLDWDADFVTECDLFEGDNETRQYGCEDGKYVMLHKQPTTRYSYYEQAYDDAEIQAEGHWVSGEGDYEYGIVWRANEDGDAYYVFTVTQDGRYNVALYKDDKYTDLIPYTASPLVNTGDTPNRFRIVAQGDRFEFYLNDSLIGSAVDGSLTSGYVGTFFYNKEPNVRVAFDELKVYTFDAALTPTPTPAPLVLDWDADFVTDCDLTEGDNASRQYGCEDGEYVMLHKEPATRYSYAGKVYDDAEIQAEGHWVDGTGDYEYGIIWRAATDGDSYYLFVVTGDGKYDVARYQDDKYTDLIPYTTSPLVNTGDTPNRFRVVAQGDQIELYLNDTHVGSVTDANLTDGYVGYFFQNSEPNARVAFDELKVYTFALPTPTTGTPDAPLTPLATAAATATSTPTVTPTPAATSAAVAPGVYVTDLRLSPSAPKQGQPVTFFVTFMNSTAKAQTFKWFVEIWEADTSKRNPYGQADARQREIPVGANERSTFDSWKRAGGGPCQSFRARVVFEDDQSRRIPFKRPDGADLWKSFQICP